MNYKNFFTILILAAGIFVGVVGARDKEATDTQKANSIAMSIQLLLKAEEYRNKE